MWLPLRVLILTGVAAIACWGGGEGEEDFETLADRYQEGTFGVAYEYAINEGTDQRTGTVVWYQNEGSMRADWGASVEHTTHTAIATSEHVYACSEAPDPGCTLHTPGSGIARMPITSPVLAWNALQRPEEEVVTGVDTRTIAGEDGTCYVLEGRETSAPREVCLSDDGAVLYVRAALDAASEISVTATEVGLELPEDAFEPPLPVTGESPACRHEAMEC